MTLGDKWKAVPATELGKGGQRPGGAEGSRVLFLTRVGSAFGPQVMHLEVSGGLQRKQKN